MSGSADPLLTVIVAVRNGERTLDRCLQSIAAQTFPHREVIVIDGASADGTVAVIKRHAGLVTFWCSEPDQGIPDAWNKGIAAARGEWICFLGADDFLWKPDCLARAAEFLVHVDKSVKVAYGSVVLVSGSGVELGLYGDPWEQAGPRFREVMSIPHQGTFHRRSLFDERGKFDLEFRIGMDYELLLRELKEGKAVFIPELVITGMGYGGLTSTPENGLLCLLEIRRAQKKNGITWPGPEWLFSVLKAIGRITLFRLLGQRLGGRVVDLGRLAAGKGRFWTKISP